MTSTRSEELVFIKESFPVKNLKTYKNIEQYSIILWQYILLMPILYAVILKKEIAK